MPLDALQNAMEALVAGQLGGKVLVVARVPRTEAMGSRARGVHRGWARGERRRHERAGDSAIQPRRHERVGRELLAKGTHSRSFSTSTARSSAGPPMPGMSKRGRAAGDARAQQRAVRLPGRPATSPCSARGTDHFGLSVESPADLRTPIHERAAKFRERDERVDIIEPKLEDYKVLKLHSFYVGYRLPLMVEIQCYEWADGVPVPRACPTD